MKQLTLVLASLGVFQALFLCVYLFTLKKGNRVANFFLALLLLGLSIRIGKSIFNHFIEISPWQRNIGLSGLLLVGPSLWLYGEALVNRVSDFQRSQLFHYILASIYVFFSGLIPNHFNLASSVSYSLVSLHLLCYIVIAEKYRRQTMSSGVAREINQWYRNIILGVSTIWIYYFAVFVGWVPYYIGGAIINSGLIYAFSYLMLKKHNFALEKYSGSKITRKESGVIVDKLARLFIEQQLYLNPKLTLNQVARQIGTAPRELSRTINEHKQQNFSEFVNRFRIEKAMQLLANQAHTRTKIATISQDCGFNNVTTFNLAFKALVQLTPSEYRSQRQN